MARRAERNTRRPRGCFGRFLLFLVVVEGLILAAGIGAYVCVNSVLDMVKRPETNGNAVLETLENLGQPFYREDKARSRREGGAGLGVALCFEIARQHGARLQYFSRPGEGTLAMVEFEKA